MGNPHQRPSNPQRPADPPPGADERRRVCRYAVVHDQAWLGWWEGPAFVNAPARILDISLRGVRLSVESATPAEKAVWFCPPSVAPAEWLEGHLIQSRKRIFGPRVVRIAFRRIFPYESFKALVYGRDAVRGYETQPVVLPAGEDDDW